MKFLIVLSIAFACATAQRFNNNAQPAAARSFEADAVALKNVFDLNPIDNSYIKSVATSNGITMEEQGYLKNPGTEREAQVMQGSYSYTGPDGVVYTVTYIADENGFRAQGDHLPKQPESATLQGAGGRRRFF